MQYLEAELQWRFRYPKYTMEPTSWHALLEADAQGDFTTVHVCEERDRDTAMCSLQVGEWSDYIVREFASEELGKTEAVFRMKLLGVVGRWRDGNSLRDPALPD